VKLPLLINELMVFNDRKDDPLSSSSRHVFDLSNQEGNNSDALGLNEDLAFE
jgi:hypothetical protein